MTPDRASRTAERVAIRRAAHQVLDHPKVLDDPVALRIVERRAEDLAHDASEQTRYARGLRAFMVARSRCAEDALARMIDAGVRQYVVLGAGLDTFAYRNPWAGRLRVFEVDHPATQAWKRTKLAAAGIALPPDLAFAPVDFERVALRDGLAAAGFDADVPAFFSWLGVSMYLTAETIRTTLVFVARTRGNTIVFDYSVAPESLGPIDRMVFDDMAGRVAAAGEPWGTAFEPATLSAELRAIGFTDVDDVSPDALNARYFAGRDDGLRVGRLARIACARV